MRVDITSMFFNSKIVNKTATPAWRTSVGQSTTKNCRIETETPGVIDNLVGITYKAQSDLTELDTKGTSGDILVCSVFDKVYVNSQKVDGKFTMLLIRETSASHAGRMQLCYSPNYSYGDYRNSDTIDKMRIALGCSTSGCWFVYDISVKNQDELHFSAVVVDKDNPVEYSGDSQDRSLLWRNLVNNHILSTAAGTDLKEEFHQYLIDPIRFKAGSTGELYWRTITSGRKEIAFLCELIKNLFGYECEDIFVINCYEEAEQLWNKAKKDPRNNFQNQICSAILGKYKDFLKERRNSTPQLYTNLNSPLQQIFYGAPGTGKSNEIKNMTGETNVGQRKFDKDFTFRVTFHPDSDYSSFVGAYKPFWDEKQEKIIYGFRHQAFLKAYKAAWSNPGKNVALIIEEINRGNCSQIFGDIFQLLDREVNGLSKYPLDCDIDLQTSLAKELNIAGTYSEEEKEQITNYYSKHYDDAFEKVCNGEIMTLPKNLSIFATMNTSDQSLFPMDSAFKRRWDWVYMPIVDGQKGWKIKVSNEYQLIDWWEFLTRINLIVADLTSSEDKQLGYYFCTPDVKANPDAGKETIISSELFVGKVIFYLWNDVFKDYAFDPNCCKDRDSKPVMFAKFYNGKSINIETLAYFFERLDEGVAEEKKLLKHAKSAPLKQDAIEEGSASGAHEEGNESGNE